MSSYLCITPIGGYKIPTPIYVNTENIGLILSNFNLQRKCNLSREIARKFKALTTDNDFSVFAHTLPPFFDDRDQFDVTANVPNVVARKVPLKRFRPSLEEHRRSGE